MRIRFPVICPVCGADSLVTHPLIKIVDGLLGRRSIFLTSSCHAARWSANAIEREQILDYICVTVFHTLWLCSESAGGPFVAARWVSAAI
jgi:hypothetical protein